MTNSLLLTEVLEKIITSYHHHNNTIVYYEMRCNMYICDTWMTYRQAGRLTDTSWPSFCASEHLTDKVGNPVEAGLMVWKDSTPPGRSKVFRACIDIRLCYNS